MIVYQFNKKQNKVQDDIKSDIQKLNLVQDSSMKSTIVLHEIGAMFVA